MLKTANQTQKSDNVGAPYSHSSFKMNLPSAQAANQNKKETESSCGNIKTHID